MKNRSDLLLVDQILYANLLNSKNFFKNEGLFFVIAGVRTPQKGLNQKSFLFQRPQGSIYIIVTDSG